MKNVGLLKKCTLPFSVFLATLFLIACNGSSNDPTLFGTLTVSIKGQGTVDRSPSGDRYAEGTTVRLAARPAEGWQFVEWRDDLAGTDPEATLIIQGDPFVTAIFAPVPGETVPLHLNVLGNGGEVAVQPPGPFYVPGTEVTLEATAREGFELWYWVGDASGTESTQTVTMDERKNITAVFHEEFKFPLEPERFSFNLYTTGEGEVVSDPLDRFLLYGHPVTLEAVPADGWQFSSWSGDISGSENPVTFILDENKFIRATFRDSAEPPDEFRLMILDSPIGEIQNDPPGEVFPAGTTVRLVAVPGPGARFLNWTGDAEGFDPEITLTMDRERTVGARFFRQF
ncbi:MAG: InlB B-repeat-containing protein [Desulfococcaceae bacterium]